MKVLIDENLSPTLVAKLGELGVAAQHVAHVGLEGEVDTRIWAHAYANDQIVVTVNAEDFIKLAASSLLHCGLVVLRSQGLSRDQQWAWIKPVFDAGHDLVNKVVEVLGPGNFTIRSVPADE